MVGAVLPASAHADPPAAPVAHEGAKVSVVANGLHDPRNMAFGPDGRLYVAEAGITEGIYQAPPGPTVPVSKETRTRCFIDVPLGRVHGSYTGRISTIDAAGNVSTFADNLPSAGYNTFTGGDRYGINALAFAGKDLFAIDNGGGCSHGHPRDPDALLRIYPDGSRQVVADLGDFLAHQVDHKDPTATDFEPDGVWYSMVKTADAIWTVEPNHGILVRIGGSGRIAKKLDMIETAAVFDPNGDGDKTFSTLIQHDGQLYIGTLGRFDTNFAGEVYTVSEDAMAVTHLYTGLSGILGMAFDTAGRLYALEIDLNAGKGKLIRMEKDGSQTAILTGLTNPGGLLPGPKGEFYVTNCGFECSDASNYPARLPSLKNGQVLKVTVPGSHADQD